MEVGDQTEPVNPLENRKPPAGKNRWIHREAYRWPVSSNDLPRINEFLDKGPSSWNIPVRHIQSGV